MKMYEDFYLFCTYVVWITFNRKNLDRVKIEVGNMLRSSVFNPALQHKSLVPKPEAKSKIETPSTRQSKRGVCVTCASYFYLV